MNAYDLSQDKRIKAHKRANGEKVYGEDAFAQRFDPITGKDRDVSHLAATVTEPQPAVGPIDEEDVVELNLIPPEQGGFAQFSPRSDWSACKK